MLRMCPTRGGDEVSREGVISLYSNRRTGAQCRCFRFGVEGRGPYQSERRKAPMAGDGA